MKFVDIGGHGYSVVTATDDFIETEFVCIPRPALANDHPDGGPLRYRVAFRWSSGAKASLSTRVLEGDPRFSL